MYPTRVKIRATVYDTCARMEPRATSEPSTLLCDEVSCDHNVANLVLRVQVQFWVLLSVALASWLSITTLMKL